MGLMSAICRNSTGQGAVVAVVPAVTIGRQGIHPEHPHDRIVQMRGSEPRSILRADFVSADDDEHRRTNGHTFSED
jgi:hypothetical protein